MNGGSQIEFRTVALGVLHDGFVHDRAAIAADTAVDRDDLPGRFRLGKILICSANSTPMSSSQSIVAAEFSKYFFMRFASTRQCVNSIDILNAFPTVRSTIIAFY
ncbi:MAG: hypothetical protein RRZ24_04195 [Clostridia bacterium]